MNQKPTAVLWDFDGTLVDTEPFWIQSEIDVMASYGVKWTFEQGITMSGMDAASSSAILMKEAQRQGVQIAEGQWGIYRKIYLNVAEMIASRPIAWIQGAQELLADLARLQIPCAVVSASPNEVLNAAIDRIGRDIFKTIIDGNSVERAKPDPQGYRMAADRLGVDISDCIVLEDSQSGSAAGRRSGAVVVVVESMQEIVDAPRQLKVKSLAGIDYQRLCEIHACLACDPVEENI